MTDDRPISDEDIKQATSSALINYTAAYRLFKYNKSLAVKCMKELTIRRAGGDELNYEELIDEKVNKWKEKLPKASTLNNGFNLGMLFKK